MIEINNWSVTQHPADAFQAPELSPPCLAGQVTSHPKPSLSGKRNVITSHIVCAEGHTITTRSGSVYLLGTIDPEYREWLRENRPDWDENNPITEVKNDNRR